MKIRILSMLLLFALLLTACGGTPTPAPVAEPASIEISPDTVTAEGKLVPAPAAELAFAQPGIVSEVMVKPGQKVASGGVIARLVGSQSVQAELAAAQLEQTLAQQALDSLERNALQVDADARKALQDAQKAFEDEANGWNLGDEDQATDLELAIDDYVLAEQDTRDAQVELDRYAGEDEDNTKRSKAQEDYDNEKEKLVKAYADLLSEIPSADENMNDDQVTLLKSIAALELARQQVERLNKGIDIEKLAAAQARLNAAQAHVRAAEAALANFELRAPFAGTLFSLDDLAAGETANAGFPVAYLAGTTAWTVETRDLAEVDIARVAIGQIATVKLDAFPGEEFSGKVTAIDPVGREYLGDTTYKVTISLDEVDPRFMWNMTSTLTIDVK